MVVRAKFLELYLAVDAVEDLVSRGYAQERVSLLTEETPVSEPAAERETRVESTRLAAELGLFGSILGMAIGLLLGLGRLFLPGVGPGAEASSLVTAIGPAQILAEPWISIVSASLLGIIAGGLIGLVVGAGLLRKPAAMVRETPAEAVVEVDVARAEDLAAVESILETAGCLEPEEIKAA